MTNETRIKNVIKEIVDEIKSKGKLANVDFIAAKAFDKLQVTGPRLEGLVLAMVRDGMETMIIEELRGGPIADLGVPFPFLPEGDLTLDTYYPVGKDQTRWMPMELLSDGTRNQLIAMFEANVEYNRRQVAALAKSKRGG